MNRPKQERPRLLKQLGRLTEGRAHDRVGRIFEQAPSLVGPATVVIPSAVMDVTREHLRGHGVQRREAALCWAGTVAEGRALVTTALLFASAGHRAGVHVSSAQTGLLYAHCYARGLTLLAQVHSHPGDAFHSSVDERSPHSAERGFLSMVVPNFGRCSFDAFDAWAIYEQEQYETWRKWSTEEKEQRLKIVDSLVLIP